MPNTRLVENQKVLPLMVPKSYSGIGGAEVYFSLKNYEHVTFIIYTGAWAAGTAAVTINQATAVAGTSHKALAFSWVWINTAALPDTYTKTAVVSNTFNLDTAGLTYIIEIDADSLDVSNAFDCLALEIASPGANVDLYAALAILGSKDSSRWPGATMPTALLD